MTAHEMTAREVAAMTDDVLKRLQEQTEWYSDGLGPLCKLAADEIERLRAMTQWQPIETAPKDGTFVLVFVCGGEATCPVVAQWTGEGWGRNHRDLFY